MATNGSSITEEAEMAECDGEKVVTMMDVLQEQQEFEDDANAVLGASDDKNCTYPKGYIKRQALYACLTCCHEAKEDSTKRAGVCLACSLSCHENHELVELYTKRGFRCDCGNPKFNSHPCQFTSKKTDLNEENYYNQNFSGLYCVCQRPYPDPESSNEDDMIQCIICEDWLHSSHLEATVPPNDQYSEMICKVCMEDYDFLHDYSAIAVNVESEDVDIVTVNSTTELTNGGSEKEKEEIADMDTDKANSSDTVAEPTKEIETGENTKNHDEPTEDKREENDKNSGESDKGSTNTDQVEKPQEESTGNPAQENDETTKIETTADSSSEVKEKPDAVMDAIDELLDETKKTNETDSKDTDEIESEKVKDTEQSEKTNGDTEQGDKTNGDTEKIEKTNGDTEQIEKSNGDTEQIEKTNGDKEHDETNTSKRKLSTEGNEDEEAGAKKPKINGEKACNRPKNVNRKFKGATFWPSNFRQKLCTCGACIEMYNDMDVAFLTDLEDTVSFYESLGKDNVSAGTSQYEKGLEALSSLDRIQQINALTEYNKMRDKLLDFLKSFKDRKEVVKEEDIKAFFAGMKPKREQDGVYFCR